MKIFSANIIDRSTMSGSIGTLADSQFTGSFQGGIELGPNNNVLVSGSISATSGSTGLIGYFTAGESLVFGDLCYVSSSGDFYKVEIADTGSVPGVGIALESISATAQGKFILDGVVRDDGWSFTPGDKLYAASTGSINNWAPTGSSELIQAIGVALKTDTIYFKPSMDIILHV